MRELDIEKEKIIDLKKQRNLYFIGFFVISVIGTLLHFLFSFSGKTLFLAPISAVNESVWEHMKMLYSSIVFSNYLSYLIDIFLYSFLR